MATSQPEDFSRVRQQRLEKMLEVLAAQGLSQNKVAKRTGVPPSYLSDVKTGNRAMTELFARRLAEEFRTDHRWILGEAGSMDSLELGQAVVDRESTSLWLAVFPHPIRGTPSKHPDWDGMSLEVCGAAAARARMAIEPYVLHFQAGDHRGQLRKHDLVLISQARHDLAEIQVIRADRKMHLARRDGSGLWERLAAPRPIEADHVEVMGYAMGIVWRPLA